MADAREEIAAGIFVDGFCDPRFDGLKQAFIDNFIERGELGASVSVTLKGETVVDLWGGLRDVNGDDWQEDTICPIYSSTKGATALCVHLLAARGELSLTQPVQEIWPEFACNGKEEARVAMMLDHSVGVPILKERIPDKKLYDWHYMAERVAAEAAMWRPGSRHGYHGLTFGWTAGELVRRVSGLSLGQFFKREFADPLGLDFWIGLPESEDPRVAKRISFRHPAGEPLGVFLHEVLNVKGSIASLFVRDSATALGDGFNTREGRAAEIPSANGITNGRGLAGLYQPFANGGGDFMTPEYIHVMSQVSAASHRDETLVIPTRFANGFMKRMDNRALGFESVIIDEAAFGHVGAGGSIGFADPNRQMSFGYLMNKAGPGLLLNPRGQSLVDAAYAAIS